MKNSVLEPLINELKKLPGVGAKSAERMVYELLKTNNENRERLATNIINLKKINNCDVCNNLTIAVTCDICLNDERDNNQLLITDDVRNINIFEDNKLFPGKYFVLNNLISPMHGVAPDDLNIEQLEKMVNLNNVNEVVLALKPNIEGEATALYIAKIFAGKVKVSKMARGIPIGAEMEYLDSLTLSQALMDRREIN